MALIPELQRVYDDSLFAGLNSEQAKAATAIAGQEKGYSGTVGDLKNGGSYGTFQLNWQGMLPAFASTLRMSLQQAAQLLQSDPQGANLWALRGYLGNALKQAYAQGYRGADLAVVAGRIGQKPLEGTEGAYGAVYNQLFGSGDEPTPKGTTPTVGIPSVTLPSLPSLPTPTIPNIANTLQSVAEQVAALPGQITAPITDKISTAYRTLAWLGQLDLWLRIGLVLGGFIVLLIGLILFALSFTDQNQVKGLVKLAGTV